jgi:tetratricopeptide (TPR) repeat protein
MHVLLRALEPRRRARRAIAAVAAAAAAGAAITIVAISPERAAAADPCAGESEQVAAAWSSERAARVRAALLATGVPYAERAADAAITTFDEWSRAWSALRVESCVAARVERTLAPEDYQARARCLDQQLVMVDARVDALEVADAEVAEVALDIAVADPPAVCANATGVGDGEGAGDEVQALWTERSRAYVLKSRGKYVEAATALRALLPRAEAADAPALAASIRIVLADALLKTGEPAEALILARTGVQGTATYQRDLETANGWRVIVDAKAMLVDGDGLEETLTAARSAAHRSGDPDQEVRTLVAIGAFLAALERFDESLRSCEEALALAARALPADDSTQALPHGCAMEALAGTGRMAEALAHAEQATEIEIRALGEDHPGTADSVRLQGVMLGWMGRNQESLAMRRRAHEILVRAHPPSYPRLWDSYNGVGSEMLDSADPAVRAEALVWIGKALALAEEHEGPRSQIAGFYHGSLAKALAVNQRLDAALVEFARAVEILDEADPDSYQTQIIRTIWGNRLAEAGRCEEAMPILEHAIAHLEHDEQKMFGVVPHVQCLLSLGRADEAVAELEVLLARLDRSNLPPETSAELDQLLARALSGSPGRPSTRGRRSSR